MRDLISRQAAIDALDVLCQEHRYRIPGKRETYSQYNEAWQDALDRAEGAIGNLPSAQPVATDTNVGDTISRQAAIDMLCSKCTVDKPETCSTIQKGDNWCDEVYILQRVPSAQPETEKYEYHYDHTDCIWYRPEARNRCPVTCAQYRDGWNDAMNYIFRDGKGYMPYRRDKQYGE